MKELIISSYDSGFGFTAKVINGNQIEEVYNHESELIIFGLYDEEWHWFNEELISPDNEKIKQFDRIIVCEDGGVEVFCDGKLVLCDE